MKTKRIVLVAFVFLAWSIASDAMAATKFWKDSITTGAFTTPKGNVPCAA